MLAVPVAVAWVRVSRQRLTVSRRWDGPRRRRGRRRQRRAARRARLPHPASGGNRQRNDRPARRADRRATPDAWRLPRLVHADQSRARTSRFRAAARGRLRPVAPRRSVAPRRRARSARRLSRARRARRGSSPTSVQPSPTGGAYSSAGRRDFEFHTVRHHVPGESLRRVHWPSTARQGTLMVKEFEDSPRDEVAVLLDGDAAGVAGSAPDSSFDAAVRAAGSILRAHVRGGRSAVLVLNTREREVQSVTTEGPEWERALGVLAASRSPTRGRPQRRCSTRRDGPAGRSLELVVVTSLLEPGLVRRLLARALAPACRHRPRRRADVRWAAVDPAGGAAPVAGGRRPGRGRPARR